MAPLSLSLLWVPVYAARAGGQGLVIGCRLCSLHFCAGREEAYPRPALSTCSGSRAWGQKAGSLSPLDQLLLGPFLSPDKVSQVREALHAASWQRAGLVAQDVPRREGAQHPCKKLVHLHWPVMSPWHLLVGHGCTGGAQQWCPKAPAPGYLSTKGSVGRCRPGVKPPHCHLGSSGCCWDGLRLGWASQGKEETEPRPWDLRGVGLADVPPARARGRGAGADVQHLILRLPLP